MSTLRALLEDLAGHPFDANAPCVREGEAWTGHADKAGQRRKAAAKCLSCPLLADFEETGRNPCLEAARFRGERWGVWGGLDLESAYRERFYSHTPRRVAECGTESGYKRHRRRGEAACGPCKHAHAAYRAEGRRDLEDDLLDALEPADEPQAAHPRARPA